MKKLLIIITITAFNIFKIEAQELQMINEPDFYAAIEQKIQYPVGAIRASVYGRIYVAFEVNSVGKINNIQIIYPILTDKVSQRLGFDAEIIGGLKKIRPLRKIKGGKFILPVAFVYHNIYYGELNQPTNRIPNELLESNFKDYTFIKEVKISARSDQFKSVRNYSNVPPFSQQLVQEF